MNLFTLMARLFSIGDADKTVAIHLAESFTGNELYWKPSLKTAK
ncbi:hypothetical protein [Mesobacillus foraminis]|nr:hypothetical protein [Mesobacillus foraminis]